jgi:phosphonate transport system substrate-binding protein
MGLLSSDSVTKGLTLNRQAFLRGALALGIAPWAKRAHAQGARLRIGLTAVILADQAAFLARWADYLSERLQARVSFVTRDEYQPLHDLLWNGQIDALWTCGFPYVRFQPQLRLVAVPLFQSHPTYQSYLIHPVGDEGVRGWRDLRGKVFAYSDPLSNSGWLVAQGQMAAAGVGGRDLKRAFFAHGHRNVAEAVAARLAQAGAIDGYVWETMRLQGMGAALQTEVLWKSPLHGFPPIVAPVGAGRPRIDALQTTLLGMAGDPSGRELLKALNLDGFVSGQPTLFESIRQLARSVPGSGVQG